MRPAVLTCVALAIAPVSPARAAEELGPLQSAVFERPGTPREIATAARACAIKHLRNDAFQIRDSSRVGFMSPPGSTAGDANTIPGGEVVTTFDPDAGLVVAQSRITRSALFGKESVQSTVTIEAKDGRFRITHSSIGSAAADTGYAANSGYHPVYIQAMSGHAKIRAALEALTEKIAACVRDAPASDDW
jgi:hypothetical protein